MLESISFELTIPTAFQFGQRFSQLLDLDFTAYSLGQYLLEISLGEARMREFKPSLVAASCCYLAKKLLRHSGAYSKLMVDLTGYSLVEVQACAFNIFYLLTRADSDPRFKSVFDKYAQEHLGCVSLLPLHYRGQL